MNFIGKHPESKSKLAGFAIRPDEYLGIETLKGFDYHAYRCTKVNRADGTEAGSTKLLSADLGPDLLQVDDTTGFLIETENRLCKPNAITGKQNFIVKPGGGLDLDESYGTWK